MKTIAFWKYDTFPFCLWGELEKYDESRFWVKGYGGSSFSNSSRIAFIPELKAKWYIAKLEKLTEEKEAADAKFAADAKTLLQDVEGSSWIDVMPKVSE